MTSTNLGLLKRLTFAVMSVLVGFAAVAIGTLYASQREMMYFPVPVGPPPKDAPYAAQEVRLPTEDGETLTAWWIAPRVGRPTILFFDGNAGALDRQDGRWRRIAQAGVGVLAVSYRGYGQSTGTPTEKGLHEDARAAYHWLAARVPAQDIVIHGFSLGSGVAVKLASERPARALVLEAPYTATVDVAAERLPWAPVRWLMKDQFPSRDWIADVHMPILIVHGDRDSVIAFHFGERLYAAAMSPKTFVRMIGGDHNTLTRDGLYDHIWRFLSIPIEGSTAYQNQPSAFELRHS